MPRLGSIQYTYKGEDSFLEPWRGAFFGARSIPIFNEKMNQTIAKLSSYFQAPVSNYRFLFERSAKLQFFLFHVWGCRVRYLVRWSAGLLLQESAWSAGASVKWSAWFARLPVCLVGLSAWPACPPSPLVHWVTAGFLRLVCCLCLLVCLVYRCACCHSSDILELCPEPQELQDERPELQPKPPKLQDEPSEFQPEPPELQDERPELRNLSHQSSHLRLQSFTLSQ